MDSLAVYCDVWEEFFVSCWRKLDDINVLFTTLVFRFSELCEMRDVPTGV